jgi:chemotaxis protein methyltransferase CheR
MRGPFDFIFCRNVMIYFDRPTQDQLVQRFGQLLRAGGCLMIGHSETLSGRAAGFTYLMPAVYQKQ